MKIFLASFGFLQEYMVTIANYLSDNNKVLLMIPKLTSDSKLRELINPDITLHFIDSPKSLVSPESIRILFDFLKLVKLERPDVINIQAHGSDWFFLAFPFLRKYPIVNTVHDPQRHLGEERYRSLIKIRLGLMQSDFFITHGLYSKKKLITDYKIPKNKIAVIPHPNFSIYRNWIKEDSKEASSSVLFYGRIREYKGLKYFLEAASTIIEKVPGVKIVIAGRGEVNSKYKEIIESSNSILLINRFISNDETAQIFQKASLLMLPYIDASQSGVLAISYAFGKPVVATNIGSLPEYVIDGITGFLVSPKDSRALAEKAIEILKNPERRMKMGQNCMIFSERLLSDNRLSELTTRAYQKAIKRKKS